MCRHRRLRPLLRVGAVLLLAGLPLPAAQASGAGAQLGCPEARMPPVHVPNLRRALAAESELVVVAIGSSSTQGAMASSRAHTYPAVLQAALASALPRSHVAVLNRGIGGQDAAEEVARLQADVLAVRPALVLWQVGANGAIRRTDPEVFKRTVADGVHRLQAAGADVVLIDNQRAPVILSAPAHVRIARALAEAAAETGASLFSRDGLMAQWDRDGHPPGGFLASDGLHHNDLGYRCVAQALAASVLDGLTLRGVAQAASLAAQR